MQTLQVIPKLFQDKFLFSEKRFPALVAGVGTGKTMMLLLKIWRFCEDFPNSLALVVRKEYTDLRDSTLKDFEQYFGVKVDSNKEHHFGNGSVVMFRHGSELNVLKNINLSIAGIEQAEEFETEETFNFIRDRLRRNNTPLHQLCVIANAKGHNWIWRMWKNNPQSVEYDLSTATTFDNAGNLPADFIQDLKTMETEAPNHYQQYVMNSFDEIDADDYLFAYPLLKMSAELVFEGNPGRERILAVDIARFGDDDTVFTVLENKGVNQWEQVFCEAHKQKDLMWTVGRFIDLRREFNITSGVTDDDGLGGGVTDRLRELGVEIVAFKGAGKPKNEELFANRRSEGYFSLKTMVDKGYLKVLGQHTILDELLTIRYKYNSKGQRLIVSKDDMRKEGIKSPDKADALMMAVSLIGKQYRLRAFEPERVKVY